MVSTGRIRVMVVDDHPIMRKGIGDVLEASGRFDVVGQAGDGEEAVATAGELTPDVIVMDVIMPRKDGIDACREIMEVLPDTKVMMLTAATEEDAVIEAVAAGATGYLQKYSPPEELVETVVAVAEGRLRIPDRAVRKVFAMVRGKRKLFYSQPLERLTELERDTLASFAKGESYAKDSGRERQQRRDRQEYPAPDTEQAGNRDQAGTGHLGRAQRLGGRRPGGGRFSVHALNWR